MAKFEAKAGCFNDNQIILILSVFKLVLTNYISEEKKITKLEIRKCSFYSLCDFGSILKMLCKDLENPGFILGDGTSFYVVVF